MRKGLYIRTIFNDTFFGRYFVNFQTKNKNKNGCEKVSRSSTHPLLPKRKKKLFSAKSTSLTSVLTYEGFVIFGGFSSIPSRNTEILRNTETDVSLRSLPPKSREETYCKSPR